MNKSYKIDYNDMGFFYAYFRQMTLSLDRCRWTSWTELKLFYERRSIDPIEIVTYIKGCYNLSDDDIDAAKCYVEKRGFFSYLRGSLFNHYILSKEELTCFCKLLKKFKQFLLLKEKLFTNEMGLFLSKCFSFYSNIFCRIIGCKALSVLDRVDCYDHYCPNEAISIFDYCPRNFIDHRF